MRGRSSRRINALTTSPEFVDAFVESALPLSTRRALRRTSRMWRRKMEEFLTKRQTLVLREQDCTDADADFVLGPLNKRHGRELNLQLEGGGHVEVFRLVEWMEKYERKPQGSTWLHTTMVPDVTITWEPNPTAAFYVGRAAATLNEARIRIDFDPDVIRAADLDVGAPYDEPARLSMFTSEVKSGDNKHHIREGLRRQLKPDDWRLIAGCHRRTAEVRVSKLKLDICLDLSHIRLDDAGARWLCDHMDDIYYGGRRPLEHKWPCRLDLSYTVTNISCGVLPYLGSHLLRATKRLHTLYLRENSFPRHPEMMQALVAACKRAAFPVLKILRLDHTHMRDEDMQKLAPCFGPNGGLAEVELVDLDNNHLTSQGLACFLLFAREMRKLRRLEVEWNDLTLSDARKLAFWIVETSGWCDIRHVSTGCHPGEDIDERKGVQKLLRNAVKQRRETWRWQQLAEHARQLEAGQHYQAPTVGTTDDSSQSD